MTVSKRRAFVQPLIRGLCVGSLVLAIGCDKGSGSSDDDKPKSEAKADGDAKSAGGDAKAEGGDAKAADAEEVALFVKDQRKKGCDMLTPAMAASALDVPEGSLKQMKIMGCNYSWSDDSQTAEASIISIWVKKSTDSAETWFANMTKTQTAEEIAAQMAKVKGEVAKRKEIDTKLEKKTADTVLDAAAGMTPDEGYVFEDVEGIGDEARVKVYDGSVTVRVRNMIFTVRAYKGVGQPPPDTAIIMSRDIKKITAAAKEAEAKFFGQTRDVRRTMSVELAKTVVAAL